MAKWTAGDIVDQAGRRVLITGANSGIGFQAARELARAGAHVELACRDPQRGSAALTALRTELPDAELSLVTLDLADLDSVRALAAGRDEPLDLLVNNAGVMALPGRKLTAQGFERQFGTNHLGHFALTGLLLEALLAGEDPRVVTVASQAHRMGSIDFDDLQGERGYERWRAYGQSKLANLLFAFELQRRADAAGVELLSVAAHPGYAATHLQAVSGEHRGNPLTRLVDRGVNAVLNLVVAQSDRAGALPTLYAATEPVPPASYAGPDGIGEWRGSPQIVFAAGKAYDEASAARLWEVSEELTGVTYDALAGARA
jgi:NAD(P)-dependent dehydrogenase (short-subunit alcohol dehydrogenase family)